MKPVFITGQDNSAAPELLKALEAAGIAPAKPHSRDAQLNLGSWHQRVLQSGQTQPSRVWEQMATELFVANIDQPQWAWADPKVLPFLDFWASFDQAIHFVLLAESPLQRALNQPATDDPQALLASWVQTHQLLLHFALRHPQRCLLVWGHEARQLPHALCAQMAQRWQLQVQQPAPTANAPAPCPLSAHLAEQLCQTHPQAQQLLAELHACVLPLAAPNATPRAQSLVDRYRELTENPQAKAQLQNLQKELKTQTERAKAAEQARAQAEAQHKQAQEQLLQAQTKAQAAEAAKTSAQSDTQKAQEQAKQANAKAQSAEQARQAADQQSKQAQEQAKQALAKAQAAEQARLSAETQNKQAQEQIKHTQEQASKASTQASQAEQSLKTTQTQLSQLQAQHKEAAEEAELLLNQLHVVQEELENYYYRNKELQEQAQTLTKLQQRWQALFAQHRDLYAAESVRIEAAPDQSGVYTCHIQQLDMAGRHFDELGLQLHIQSDGCAALALQRPEQGSGPLLRWPTDVQAGATLLLHPATGTGTTAQQVAAYMQLTTSDWQLVQDLPQLVLQALPQTTTLDEAHTQTLRQALQLHAEQIKAYGGMLHFDTASCPTAPDNEQLHLQLQQVRLGAWLADQIEVHIQRTAPDQYRLQLSPNALTGEHGCQLNVGPQGWQEWPAQQQPTRTDAQHQRLTQLVANLPLALSDAARSGADKASLKAWADATRQLRQWLQTQAPAPAPAEKPSAAKQPTHAKTSSKATTQTRSKAPGKSAVKAAVKTAVKAPAPTTGKTAAKPSAAATPPTAPPPQHAAKTRRKARA